MIILKSQCDGLWPPFRVPRSGLKQFASEKLYSDLQDDDDLYVDDVIISITDYNLLSGKCTILL
jgi:hypothetical protein